MRLTSFEAIARALDDTNVRYLLAGHLAVNAHDYLCFTKDADQTVQLVPDNIARTFAALGDFGYQPNVPITAWQFLDPQLGASWIRDTNTQVLQFCSDTHRETPVGVFVTEPFDFDAEYQQALVKPLYNSIEVRFVSIPTLIRMKQTVGQTEDLIDIEHLRMRLDDEQQADSVTDDIDWNLTTFEGARREQLRRWAGLSLEDIIRCLEEMQHITRRLHEMRKIDDTDPLAQHGCPRLSNR